MDTQRKGGKKNRKHYRNGRAAKHRLGQVCGAKNCRKLLDSRKWDEKLGAYVAR